MEIKGRKAVLRALEKNNVCVCSHPWGQIAGAEEQLPLHLPLPPAGVIGEKPTGKSNLLWD